MSTPTKIDGTLFPRFPGELWICLNGTAVDDSGWVDSSWANSITIDVQGLATGDVVSVHISNSETKPLSSDHQLQAGNTITSNTFVEIQLAPLWIKVRKTTAGGSPGTTTAKLLLRS